MTKPREWGNSAKELRDRSVEEAISATRKLEPLLDHSVTEEERYRRIASAIISLQKITHYMVLAGAPVRQD